MYKLLMCAVLLSASTAVAQDKERIETTRVDTPDGSLTSTTVTADYEVDRRRDQGWNAPWGLVFSFTNILQNRDFLTNFQNLSAAGTLVLSPDFMIRGGGSLSRSSDPSQTTETSLTTPDGTVKTYSKSDPGTTSDFSVTLRAEGLYRLTRNKVAPYIGGGPYVTVGHFRDTVTDNVSVPDVTTSVRNRRTTISAGLRAVLGAEWRIHSSFALFAEYGLSLDVVTWSGVNNSTSTVNNADGTVSGSTTRSKTNSPAWLNLDSGLQQGATLGLIVFF
jgi:hypothetical protein